jgi:hypothetical protein
VRVATLAMGALLALVTVGLVAPSASARSSSNGYGTMSTSGAGEAPTGDKPQSKLWYNAGAWWGVLFHASSQTWHIYALNRAKETWSDSGVRVDDRPNTRADVLWDGKYLYVASNVVAPSASANSTGKPARLYRFQYNRIKHKYVLDKGFPVSINNVSSESLTLDKDSKGVLWATWTQNDKVYVNSTVKGDLKWGTPFVPAIDGANNLSDDDISTLAAAGGGRVGLLWSNQATSEIVFASHKDGDPRTTWRGRVATSGTGVADDHVNLKGLKGDKRGHLYAAVKTSGDLTLNPDAAQTVLLDIDVAAAKIASIPFGTVSDCHTRPVLVIDSQKRQIHYFATAPLEEIGGCPHSGTPGAIYEKVTSLDHPSFSGGRGTVVVRDPGSDQVNNPTATKQNVTAATGLVVLASNDKANRYWHNDLKL